MAFMTLYTLIKKVFERNFSKGLFSRNSLWKSDTLSCELVCLDRNLTPRIRNYLKKILTHVSHVTGDRSLKKCNFLVKFFPQLSTDMDDHMVSIVYRKLRSCRCHLFRETSLRKTPPSVYGNSAVS